MLPQAPTEGTAGTPLSYVVALENRDTTGAGATDVTINVPLPAGLQFDSATATQGSRGPRGAVVVCTLGTMASRGSASVTIHAPPRAVGTMQVRATVTLDEADADTTNDSATAVTAVRGTSWAPRPKVTVTTARGAPGELIATAVASSNPGMPTSFLRAIQLGAPVNARVDIGGQRDLKAPTTVSLPPGSQQATVVRRVTAGQTATVPLTIVDDCGEWPTFVGGGPSAF